jgi:energy-coupling factor transporter ATP-binding protein EcfA2
MALGLGPEDLAALKAAQAILEIAQRQGWLDKLKDVFRSKHDILILGSTGTGKSNFVRSLRELVPEAIDHMNRTQWATREKVTLAGEVFRFTDTPGQTHHGDRRTDAIRRAVEGGRPFGIINVVCGGYHEYLTGKSEALLPNGAPNPTWISEHLAVEIDAALQWVPLLAVARPKFVLTLVSKADLWWHDRETVLRHYEVGAYRKKLALDHIVLPYSSTYHRFYDSGITIGAFESKDRVTVQERFLEELFRATAQRQ